MSELVDADVLLWHPLVHYTTSHKLPVGSAASLTQSVCHSRHVWWQTCHILWQQHVNLNTHIYTHAHPPHAHNVASVWSNLWLNRDYTSLGEIIPAEVTSEERWKVTNHITDTCDGRQAIKALPLWGSAWNGGKMEVTCMCRCWVIAQVRAARFSAYYSDSVPAAAYSAAVNWGACRGGALLIFTDGNNARVVMNGAAWWESGSNVRCGRENVVFPEDNQAVKTGGGQDVWTIRSNYEAVIGGGGKQDTEEGWL